MAIFPVRRCVLCHCTDSLPCFGGVLFPGTRDVHRLVGADVLEPGTTCSWLDVEVEICSAHTNDELLPLDEGRLFP